MGKMMQKHFIWQDMSYWDQNGCSCCEPTFIESWSCVSHEEIEWSCWDTTDCIRAAISFFDSDFDKERELDDVDVRWRAHELGLSFSFVGAEQ